MMKTIISALVLAGSLLGQCQITINPLTGMFDCISPASAPPSGGAVGGASSLTTAGAVAFVASAGVLTSDPTNFSWSSTNGQLAIQSGTAAEKVVIGRIAGSTGVAALYLGVSGTSSTTYAQARLGSGDIAINAPGLGNAILFQRTGSTESGRIAGSSGNLLWGGVTTDGGFRLDVNSSGTNGTERCYDQTASTGVTQCVARAGAGQSTTPVSVWQSNAGSTVASVSAGGNFSHNALVGIGTTPSISSGTIGTGSRNSAGFITSSTTGAYTGVLTFSGVTAPVGWSCMASNATTVANPLIQTASSQTTATLSGTTVSGDVLRYTCMAY